MTDFTPALRHTRRPISDLGLHAVGSWQVKLYGIAGKRPEVSSVLVAHARTIAARTLPEPAVTPSRYGVAFVIVHEARAFNTILVDWWEQVNELRHHVFRAPAHDPETFTEITASGEAVCVWELRVQAFEREAWLRHVLANPAGPDLGAYLGARIDEVC